ncbi:MAG: lysophospholipid acyltransferase family protein [Gammaproteobacteria bacterium]
MIGLLFVALTRFVVGGHAQWHGTAPAARQRIYFANHSSHLDTLLIWSALPGRLRACTHPVAGADYWNRSAIRRLVSKRGLNAVLVERSGQGADPLAPLRGALCAGRSLVIFPEGTRGAERLPSAFKSGLYWLAVEFPDVELVPVYLENPARAFPKGALLPVPITCTARFGQALERIEAEGKPSFLERARLAVCALAPDTVARAAT